MKKFLLLVLSTVFLFNILFVIQEKLFGGGIVGYVSQYINPAWTILVILILAIAVVVEGNIFTLLMIVVGSVYGMYPAIAIGVVSSIVGMSIGFLSVRHFGHGKFMLLERHMNDLKRFQKIIKKDFVEGLWIVHVLPLTPNPLFIVASAMTKIKLPNFLLISLIAQFPYMLIAISLGTKALSGNVLAVLVYGLVISGLLTIVLFRKEIKHHFVHA